VTSRELTPRELATELSVHYDTVVRWCAAAVDGDTTSRLFGFVTRNITGRYQIREEVLHELRKEQTRLEMQR